MDGARNLLQQTMEQMKWRAPQVAAALGCSDDVVRRWLRNERRMQLDDVIRLAQISGADLNEVFGLQVHEGGGVVSTDQIREMVQEEVQATLGRIFAAGLGTLGAGDIGGIRDLAETRRTAPGAQRSNEHITANAAKTIQKIAKEREETGYTRRRKRG
jgi:transcriptional regulator with XRE-family HTH domain